MKYLALLAIGVITTACGEVQTASIGYENDTQSKIAQYAYEYEMGDQAIKDNVCRVVRQIDVSGSGAVLDLNGLQLIETCNG